MANSISAHSAKTRVQKPVASSWQTKHTHTHTHKNMSSTSSASLKHGCPTNRIAHTFVPILINSCIFLLVPERFFRGTQGQFLHIGPNLNDHDNDVTTAFLYMTDGEFLAVKGLTREVLARSDTELASCLPPLNHLYPDITHVYTSAT